VVARLVYVLLMWQAVLRATTGRPYGIVQQQSHGTMLGGVKLIVLISYYHIN